MPILRYHERTHDLLTNKEIDPQQYLDRFEEYRQSFREEIHLDPEAFEWTNIDLYKRPVATSDLHVRFLDDLQRNHQITLPPSLYEWYSLDYGPQMLFVRYNGTMPNLISKLHSSFYFGEQFEPLKHGVIEILADQQGGCWVVPITTKELDPPVLWLSGDTNLDKFDIAELPIVTKRFSDNLFSFFWVWLAAYQFNYAFRVECRFVHPDAPEKLNTQLPFNRQLAPHSLAEFRLVYSDKNNWYFENVRVRMVLDPAYMVQSNGKMKILHDRIGGGTFFADDLDALHDLILNLWSLGQIPFDHLKPHFGPRHNEVSDLLLWMRAKYGDR